MITKEKLKEHIEKFPDTFSMDELIERLIFIDKLEKRIQQSQSGEAISEDELKEDLQKWFE
ncbi:hypothetical protein [Robiginitalea marina]|jgi:flagellar biosynthesis chaperone FliJ|uniref:Uncharacterized protein n=1 Tax=Robiginitalea marina TaxID=2954105 RepID=A0ABT1AW60_9FLAO|nr:hypothetical protein [Robiginitalea marina]MCO5724149.1 hypothetical protein [Robiginitalea marina]MEE4178251.1 hypothetical protein [Bacteroides sp.]